MKMQKCIGEARESSTQRREDGAATKGTELRMDNGRELVRLRRELVGQKFAESAELWASSGEAMRLATGLRCCGSQSRDPGEGWLSGSFALPTKATRKVGNG